MGQFAENVFPPGTEPSDDGDSTGGSTVGGTGGSTDGSTDSGNETDNEDCTDFSCHQQAGLQKVSKNSRYSY